MMILRSSGASPFGRKVKIAAKYLGLMDSITVKDADTNNPADSLRQENPLGKIPALILEDGTVLYDSRVIVEYLDVLDGQHRLIPADTKARFAALTLQTLADGMMDACVIQIYEQRWRPEDRREAKWVAYQAEKVSRVLNSLEASPPSGPITIGHVAVACSVGYLDLRFEGKWRASYPRLVAWLDAFSAAVPGYEQTRFTPPV